MPSLSVIICTRDRGPRVLGAVRSILSGDVPDLELLIIDQSSDDAVESALAAFTDSRIRYVRTRTRGLSAARNVGLRLAQSAIVAMTDDDCAVTPGWASGIQRTFAEQPKTALVFGNVEPVPFDQDAGFIPRYERTTAGLATGLRQKMTVEGIGACMALRRDVVVGLGGFDEMLGAGGRFRAGEDVDLTLRVLGAGHAVYETPAIRVFHAGFHTWAAGRTLVQSYWFGAGAAFGKHVRVGGLLALGVLGQLAWRFVAGQSPVARGLGLDGMTAISRLRLTAFRQGFAAGISTRVHPATRLFHEPDRAAEAASSTASERAAS